MEVMEAPYATVLRKNLHYLRQNLQVNLVLDHLFQEGVLKEEECECCQTETTGHGRTSALIKILRKKGEDGYKAFCAILDHLQPHVKAELDNTALENGAINLLYVNKDKAEQKLRETVSEWTTVLQDKEKDMEHLQQKLASREKELSHTRAELEEEKKRQEKKEEESLQLLEEERRMRTKEENEKLEVIKRCGGLEDEVRDLKEKLKITEKDLEDERELIRNYMSPIKNDEQEKLREVADDHPVLDADSCSLNISEDCNTDHLRLLPCLHPVCEACIQSKEVEEKVACHCGEVMDLEQLKHLPVDNVRNNEAAYRASKIKMKICTFGYHDKNEDSVFYCQDEEVSMCLECKSYHDKFRRNESHSVREVQEREVIPIQKWLSEANCDEHPHHKVELFDGICQKSVCLLCSHGKHSNHLQRPRELNLVFEERTVYLKNTLVEIDACLQRTEKSLQSLLRHRESLENSENTLIKLVTEVFKNFAKLVLARNERLQREIMTSFRSPYMSLQTKIRQAQNHKSVLLFYISYVRRMLTSTRKSEFVALSNAVQKKWKSILSTELPVNESRDVNIRFSFEGQKVLQKQLGVFGSLATCPDDRVLEDSESSPAEILQRYLASKEKELEKAQKEINELRMSLQEKTRSIEESKRELLQCKQDVVYMKCEVKKSIEMLNHFGVPTSPAWVLKDFLQKVCRGPEYTVGSRTCLVCPPMFLDGEKLDTSFRRINQRGELVNNRKRSQREKSKCPLKWFRGTISAPIPPVSPLFGVEDFRYWETHSRISMNGSGELRNEARLFEIGLCNVPEVDTAPWVSAQTNSSWAASIRKCGKHGCFCIQIFGNGRQVCECIQHQIPRKSGESCLAVHGVVLNTEAGRLAFVDSTRVLHKFQLKFAGDVVPTFAVYPCPELYTIEMKLVSGLDTKMSRNKMRVIMQALN